MDTKTDEMGIVRTSRGFDIVTALNQGWFESYLAQLSKYLDREAHPDYSVRQLSDIENPRVFRDPDLWVEHVRANWEDVAETEVWSYRGALRSARCDHRRQHLRVEFALESLSAIEESLDSLEESLSLKPTPQEPYQYRRSSLEFDIGSWRPDLFADGVRRIATYLGGNPGVRELYVKTYEGDVEKLVPFYEIKEFLQYVGHRASRFGEVSVGLQARSIGVGILVPPDHKKLRIRTTLPPESVDELLDAWPTELGLRQAKAQDSGSGVEAVAPTPPESALPKYGVPILVALITSLSVTSVIALQKAIFPDYTLVITSPPHNRRVVTVRPGAIPVRWYVKPVQASFRSDRKDVPAVIRVYGSVGMQQSFTARPPRLIKLEPGSYAIEVDAPEAPPAQIQVLVK